MIKNLHKGHRSRLKQRYIKNGLDSFEDNQVLELLLFYCYPQRDTNEIAHKMINKFGSLHNLLEASPIDIMKECNVTENVAVLVSLTPHLSKRYIKGRWSKKDVLDNTKIIGEFAIGLFIGRKYECLYIICLDVKHQLLDVVLATEGTIDSAAIYTRNIVEIALRHNASSVVLAHNHPSGSLKPSREDIEMTKRIVKAFESIDIDVVDHVIVGGEKYFSFSEKRLLNIL